MKTQTASFGVSALAAAALALETLAGSLVYSFGWYRNQAVENFPVPIVLEEGRNGFSYEGFSDLQNGSDLRVLEDGNPLPIEIEKWNPEGKSVVWVKVPSFSSETELTVSWGNAEAATASASGMWSDSMAVMHFGDEKGLNSAQGDVLSPFNGRDVSAASRSPVGNGAVFNKEGVLSTTEAESEKYWPVTNNQFTVSLWMQTDKFETSNNKSYMLQWSPYWSTIKDSSANQIALLFSWYDKSQLAFYFYGNQAYTGNNSIPRFNFPTDGRWHHVACTYDGETVTAYIDGSVITSAALTGFSLSAWGEYGGYLSVGGTPSGSHPFDGMMDEVRIERVCRDAAWIRACVETQAHGLDVATVKFVDYDGAALENFPAYVHIDSNMGVDTREICRAVSNRTLQVRDMRTGVILPAEVEYAYGNDLYDSVGLWVNMPSYSAVDGVMVSAPAAHYLPDGTETERSLGDVADVWASDDYLLVFHMNPTGYLHDVKSQVRLIPSWQKGKGEYLNAYPVVTDGPTGPYQAYWSTTNAVQYANKSVTIPNRSITNVYTVSWWAKIDEDEFADPKDQTYTWTLLDKSGLMGEGYSWAGVGANKMVIWGAPGGSSIEVPDTAWHQYVYTYDGKKTRGYLDGVLVKEVSGGKNFELPEIAGVSISLMGSSDAPKDAFRGKGDELRLETVCRDADWIKAAYLNQLAWRNGTPWQYAPHFAADVEASVTDGEMTATATLSCRTNATVTAYWGRTDGGEDAAAWDNSSALGLMGDGIAETSAELPKTGARYAVRFRAVNEHGEAWSNVRYFVSPREGARGGEVPISVNYDGAETLTNFPLCVRVPAANKLPDNFAKVCITDEDGLPLAWEAETWNPSGESVLWVLVPKLTATTKLKLEFHDDEPDDGAWSDASVWPDDFAGVWHFSPSDKTGVTTVDSSRFDADITDNARKPDVTNGVAGSSYYFKTNTTGFFRSKTYSPLNDFRDGFTFSFWAALPDRTYDEKGWSTAYQQDLSKHELKYNTSGIGYVQYVMRYNGAGDNVVDFLMYFNDSRITPPGTLNSYRPSVTSTTASTGGAAVSKICRVVKPDTGWHQYVFTHDGSSFAVYLDGELVNSVCWPFVLNTGTQGLPVMQTGFGGNTTNAKLAYGALDEYRIERVGRSADWIKACYDNQRQESTFVTVGPTRYPGMVISVR